ncbi:hypothetical protein [Streptomyces sp. NPDC092307]|uniref:hypothetical protein n=1 Tax=Streptomyces sp. NPDC092307 TaxID=3366013 RepID=UPI00381BE7E8
MAAIPLDLLDRIRELERRVRELTGRANIRPALDEITHGHVRIAEGGTLDVYAPNGVNLFGVGDFGPEFAHPDGSPQQGVVMSREDGSVAFSIWADRSGDLGGAGSQAISLWDRAGNVVLSDETTTGWGVGTPYLPLALHPVGQDPIVTSGEYTNRWFGAFPAQQPVASILLEIGAGGGSTADVTVQYRTADETAFTDIGTFSVTAPSAVATWDTRWVTFPLDRAQWLLTVFVRVQIRQRSGSNGVTVNFLGGHTRRTLSRDEIPDPRPPRTAARHASAPKDPGPLHGVADPSPPPPTDAATSPFSQSPPATAEPAAEPEPGLRTIDD